MRRIDLCHLCFAKQYLRSFFDYFIFRQIVGILNDYPIVIFLRLPNLFLYCYEPPFMDQHINDIQ